MNSKELKILCLEDNEGDAFLIHEQLRGEGLIFQFDHVLTEFEYTGKLKSEKYDIILSDYNLPGFSGIAALMLSKKICPDVPFICVSGTIGEDLAVELMHIGASDYIIKDKLSKLPVAIERSLLEAEEHKSRIEAELFLKESEARLRDIIMSTYDWVWEIDRNWKYIYSSDTIGNILGYTNEEVIGKSPFDFMSADEKEIVGSAFSEIAADKGIIKDLENWNIHKDGHRVCLLKNGYPIFDETGNLIGYRGVDKDITERKLAEQKIRDLNINLEKRVKERTTELATTNEILTREINVRKETEEALSKAKKIAEDANGAKSEFLANMSHEIRTPMNAVLGYADLLAQSLEDKTQKDYVESIKSSGRGLLNLINDILDLSKIEARKLELEFEYVNTEFFFSEFERIFSMKVSEKGLKFILDIASGTPTGLYVDETRLRQIIFNLIGNAIKFTEKGFVRIKVFSKNPHIINLPKDKKAEYIDLIIEVEDSGIGISKEFQKVIFDPFTQQSGQKKYGGTGLGLAITKRLISLMSGTISVKSELIKGSTFLIKIPEVIFIKDFETTTDIQHNTQDVIFDRAKIIVADDVESNRKYLIDALKDTNIIITEAENGQIAYLLAQKIIPDLIITDIRMPVMNGFELLDKLKQDKKLKHIPVIAYSASVMKGQKERIHKSKFAGFLIKPVQPAELFLELMNHLPYKSDKISGTDLTGQKIDYLKEINDLTGLINSLETTFTDIWKTFATRQPMNEIEEFGKKLINLGKGHNADLIIKFGEELVSAVHSFNIKAILKLIKKYPVIIDDLKDPTREFKD